MTEDTTQIDLLTRPDLYYDEDQGVFVPIYDLTPKEIWLTFDDGPHPAHTRTVLDALDTARLKATFFVVGLNAERQPQMLRDISSRGHRIGNHSFTHAELPTLTDAEIRAEIEKTDKLIAPYVTGPKILRPPFGATNARVSTIARQLGYREVLWTVDTLDWKRDMQPDGWVQNGIGQIRARRTSVVLMHDIHPTTAANVGTFIAGVRALPDVVFKDPGSL